MASQQLRFGATNYAENLDAYAHWAGAAESAGFELLCYGDSQSLWLDSFVALSVAATHTSTARLGPMVANPVTRHPAVTAGGMASLQQLSDGRMVCGIGVGDSALHNIGERPATRAQVEEYATAVRGLCAGEEVDYRGTPLRLHWETRPVPVWLAAGGPKMLHLAGQIADGVVLGNGIGEEVVTDSIARVRAGAESVGRRLEDIELWWLVKPYISDTEEEGWRYLSWTLAGSAHHTFRAAIEQKFVPEPLLDPLRGLQDTYAAQQHGKLTGQGGHNAALVDSPELLAFLGRRFALTGPPQQIVERLEEAAGYGATNFVFTLQVADQHAFMHRLADEVFSAL